jgi:hypothetical protein
VRNANDFSTINWERQRLVDRVRLAFCGRAYKRRFAERAAQHGIVFSSRQPSYRWVFSAASVAMLSVVGCLGWQLHQAGARNRAITADLQAARQSKDRQQQHSSPQAAPPAPEVRIARRNGDEWPQQARLELDRARTDLERERAGALELAGQLKQARDEADALLGEIAGSKTVETRLSEELRKSELRMYSMTAELTRLQAGRSEDTETIAAQNSRVRELTNRLKEVSDGAAREQKLLVADVDMRELMGARSLHIVDVFDVDGKGRTQRPYGRIFYTEGKSLLFYAFDLKGGGTFQAWGQKESREEAARSLGVLHLDDQKLNRWVLKFDDPAVLAEINSVFVTAEPPGGSLKPNSRKTLYAYLNGTANHP